jgi:hypothetical protein
MAAVGAKAVPMHADQHSAGHHDRARVRTLRTSQSPDSCGGLHSRCHRRQAHEYGGHAPGRRTMCGSSGGCYSDRVCSSTEVITNGGLNADGKFPDRWA